MRSILVGAALLLAGGCQQQAATLRIEDARIRLAANPANPAALYFKVEGGAQPDRLLGVTTQVSTRTELHESMQMGGVMTMRPLPGVDVPARGEVEFVPGGKHVMLFGLPSDMKPFRTVNTEFTFASGTRLSVMVPTRAAGEE